jgi:hypothetical protein
MHLKRRPRPGHQDRSESAVAEKESRIRRDGTVEDEVAPEIIAAGPAPVHPIPRDFVRSQRSVNAFTCANSPGATSRTRTFQSHGNV